MALLCPRPPPSLRLALGLSLPKGGGEGRALLEEVALAVSERLPFESAQLAKYYAQVLGHARISFWFSLLFAALGFATIIIASIFYTNERNGATIASFVAGIIIDAVSALFFVQSRMAQGAMAEFFGKLRTDRANLESRKLADIIEDPVAKDALRIHLALHLAGILEYKEVAQAIIGKLATANPNEPFEEAKLMVQRPTPALHRMATALWCAFATR